MQTKVIIECLKGSNEKFELDEKDGKIKLNFVFSARGGSASGGKNLTFPFYYGYIPGTRGGDGDMLDAVVISSRQFNRGEEVVCNLLGYVEVVDRGEEDNKLVLVPIEDIGILDIKDIPQATLQEWKSFWQEVAIQKNKIMEVKSFRNKKEAEELLNSSIKSEK